MVRVHDHAPVTDCLHVPENYRRLPPRSKSHFVPRSGRGKFDRTYDPGRGNLDITVRLHLATGTTWIGPGFSSQDLEGIRREDVSRG